MLTPTDLYNQVVFYFQLPDFTRFIFWARVISYAISTLLMFAMIILISRSRAVWWVSESIDSFRKAKLPERMKKDWERINDRAEKNDDASLKLAVIEADNMLEESRSSASCHSQPIPAGIITVRGAAGQPNEGVLEAH